MTLMRIWTNLLLWNQPFHVKSAFKWIDGTLHCTCCIDFPEAFVHPCCYKTTDCSWDVKCTGVTPPKPHANSLFHFANTSTRGPPSIWFLSNHRELCFPFWLLGVGLASSVRSHSVAMRRALGCVLNLAPWLETLLADISAQPLEQ